MLTIKVNIEAGELVNALGRLVDAGKDTSPLTQILAQTMEEAAKNAFASESDPVTGARWPRLHPDYSRARQARGHTGPLLQVDGTLVSSLHQESGNGFARVGTNLTYAAIHQFGGTTRAHWIRPRSKKALAWSRGGKKFVRRAVMHPGSEIPRRRFLGVGPQDKQDMREDIRDYLRRALFGRGKN